MKKARTIKHKPFGHPCKEKRCKHKDVNGRCLLEEHISYDGDCLTYSPKENGGTT